MKYILPRKQLKLGRIMDSRDPYEYQAFKIRLLEDNDLLQNDNGFVEFIIAAKDLKLNSQYLCFCIPKSEHIGNEYYTRWGYDRPKLWESYGDKHQGICIALNREKIISEFNAKMNGLQNGQLAHDRIVYKDIVCRSQEIKPKTLSSYYRDIRHFNQADFLEEFKQSFFFQKDHDYQDENEYRLVYITSQHQEDLSIDISHSVTALYLGDKVERSFIEYYKKLFKKEFPETEIKQVHWFNGTVELITYSN